VFLPAFQHGTIIVGGDEMRQRKRPGGNDGLGYYTSWDKSAGKGCIYCGKSADTREHAPSKVFLNEPFPENLPTIPACFECNNSYSADEKYVACILDVLKSKIYSNCQLCETTVTRIEKDELLKKLIEESVQVNNGRVYFDIDESRLVRILVKLARGHAGYEWDYVNFDDEQIKIRYDYLFNLSDDDLHEFNSTTVSLLWPEVGSRGLLIVEDLETGDASGIAPWNDVQENQYRYQVDNNEQGGVCAKIVIYEFLYCQIDFE